MASVLGSQVCITMFNFFLLFLAILQSPSSWENTSIGSCKSLIKKSSPFSTWHHLALRVLCLKSLFNIVNSLTLNSWLMVLEFISE